MGNGKAYANRKQESERPEADFYSTPKSITQLICDTKEFSKYKTIYEPMSGENAIAKVLIENGHEVITDDIRTTKKDFLKCNEKVDYICTNPAFSIFTETVEKCHEITNYGFTLLGKTNFFAAHSRTKMNLWRNLKHVYIFDRMIDYRTPYREDGCFFLGNLVTCWMCFDKSWHEPYWNTSIMDVQKWATLGSYDNYIKKEYYKVHNKCPVCNTELKFKQKQKDFPDLQSINCSTCNWEGIVDKLI